MDTSLFTKKAGAISGWARAHKKTSIGIALVVAWIIYRSFFGAAAVQARYIIGTVTRGTLTTTLSGVAQIAASDQIDLKPKVSAEVTSVAVVAGQEVKQGQVIAYLDTRDAAQTLQNAKISLQNAQITLQKLQQNQSVDSTTAQEDLDQAYEDSFTGVTSVFLQLPTIIESARAVLYDNTLHGSCTPNICEYGNLMSSDGRLAFSAVTSKTEADYAAAKSAYDPVFEHYRLLRRGAPKEDVQRILDDTIRVVDLTAQILKSERNMLDTLVSDINTVAANKGIPANVPSMVSTYQATVSSAIGTTNTFATSLASEARTIRTAKQALANAQLSNPLDLASQQNVVSQRAADLRTAQLAYADHTIRAPFDGVVAKVSSKRGDAVGSATVIATVISHKQLAVLQLNEVDVAKAQLGQKTTLAFDALPDLMMTGTVAEIDALGTTTQGVVNYNVTIALDTQDAQVRPGMSASVVVLLQRYPDVLIAPSAAVKVQAGAAYVEVLDMSTTASASAGGVTSTVLPTRVPVTIGVSDDSSTQILSGLTEGQEIVVRTIAASTTSTTSAPTRTSTAVPGGGAFRALGR